MSEHFKQLGGISAENEFPLLQAMHKRRTIREFSPGELSERELTTLLWAASGVSENSRGFRTAPSAGATYPIELYVMLTAGIYKYLPEKHKIFLHKEGDFRSVLCRVSINQRCIEDAAVVLIFCFNPDKIIKRYKERSYRYACIEVGHMAQNVLLTAVALELGAAPIGAYHDDAVKKILQLPHDVLYMVPIGRLVNAFWRV